MDFRELREFIKDFGSYIIVGIVVILLFMYVIAFIQVQGPSMQNTFTEGDLVFLSKVHYKFSDVKRGEIIIFENNGVKNLIKRVIGLPGEKVEFKNNTLYINGQAYEEDYLSEGVTTNDYSSGEIPENCYIVLGANRNNAQDSRDLGCIKKEQIIGKVIARFWPVNKMKMF